MDALFELGFGRISGVLALACLLFCGRKLHKRRAERAALRATIVRNLENFCSPRLAETQLQQSPLDSGLAQ